MARDIEKARNQKTEIDAICRMTGWTQKELAERAGLKPSTVNRVTSGYALSAVSVTSIRNAAAAARQEVIQEQSPTYATDAASQVREHIEKLLDERAGDPAEIYWLLKELRDNYPTGVNSAASRSLDNALDVAEEAGQHPPVRSSR